MGKKTWIILWVTGVILATSITSFAKEALKPTEGNLIQAKAGKEFAIILESNVTTGYRWQLASPIDRDFLMVVGLRYVAPKTKAVGVGGWEEWTFKTVKPGKVSITFNYARSWEKNKAPAKTRTFVVVIK